MINSMEVQYIGRCNMAERVEYENDAFKTRFKMYKRSSRSFTLHIVNITKEDAGIYSCVVKNNKHTLWNSGTALLPGGLYAV